MRWLWDFVAGSLTGVLSGFGIGGGTILTVYMTTLGGLSQHVAQGVNLLYFLPCASGALYGHVRHKFVDFSCAIPAILGGLPAAALAAYLASLVDDGILRRLFAAGLIYVGLREMTIKRQPVKS